MSVSSSTDSPGQSRTKGCKTVVVCCVLRVFCFFLCFFVTVSLIVGISAVQCSGNSSLK